MNQSPLRGFVLGRIEQDGRQRGAPAVTFSERKVVSPGEDIYVANGFRRFITSTSGFYLPLPPNAFGVVIFPDGTSHNMDGGIHEAPPGLYKLQYVDKHERFDFTSPISEMTTDGEKLTLKVILRYRVIDPIVALRIDQPVKTLIEHIESDVAQYIRTHDHTDIADSSENQQDSKILSFFIQRHNRRFPLSKAFIITGVELKDFAGDNEYVEMRRKASMDIRKNNIENEQVQYKQKLEQLKVQYKADNEKSIAENKAIIEKIEAQYEKEKEEILLQVYLQKIDLDDRRERLQRRENEFAKAIEAISTTFSSGYPTNPNIIKTMTDLVAALKEEVSTTPTPTAESVKSRSTASEKHSDAHPSTPTGSDKVEKLTNTLLGLLNPKR